MFFRFLINLLTFIAAFIDTEKKERSIKQKQKRTKAFYIFV